MSCFVPSNQHINAIVAKLVDMDVVLQDDAIRLMHDMRSESYSFVASSQTRQDGFVPQSTNDRDYPFTLQIDIDDLTDEQFAGLVSVYQDNASTDVRIDDYLREGLDMLEGVARSNSYIISNGDLRVNNQSALNSINN